MKFILVGCDWVLVLEAISTSTGYMCHILSEYGCSWVGKNLLYWADKYSNVSSLSLQGKKLRYLMGLRSSRVFRVAPLWSS